MSDHIDSIDKNKWRETPYTFPKLHINKYAYDNIEDYTDK